MEDSMSKGDEPLEEKIKAPNRENQGLNEDDAEDLKKQEELSDGTIKLYHNIGCGDQNDPN